MDLDQPGHAIKMVKMDDVVYVPGLSRNLLSTVKAVEQWGKALLYYRNKAVLGFPGEKSPAFKFCPRRGLFSATGARRIPRQEVTLEENLTENGLVKIASGTALAMRAGASRDVMKIHRMLARPSEDITRKTGVMMGIATTGQWGLCEARLQVKTKRQAVQWIDGPDKTSSNGFGDEDLSVKPGEGESVGRRGALQLEVRELELEQQPASLELRKEVQEALPDPEQGIREAPPDPAEETWKAPSDRKEETREDPLNPEEETREVPLDPEEETWEVPWDPEKETREVPLNLKEGTQEAPSDREDEAHGTPSYPEEETLEAPSDPEKETLEAPSDPTRRQNM